MKTITILGVGSPFGDDQAGWTVIERLQLRGHLSTYAPKLHLEKCDRPYLQLIEKINKAEVAHIIDAVRSQHAIGTLHRFELEQLTHQHNETISTHAFGVINTLSLAAIMNQLSATVIIHGIEISPVSLSNQLSTPLLQSCDQLAQQIETEIISFIKKNNQF